MGFHGHEKNLVLVLERQRSFSPEIPGPEKADWPTSMTLGCRKHTLLFRLSGALALLILLVGLPTATSAQEPVETSNYISRTKRGLRPKHHAPSFPAPVFSLGGTSTFPLGGGENLAQAIEPGPGFRITAAWQPSEEFSVEFSYSASTHETNVDQMSNRGFFQGLHLGANLFPMKTQTALRPFFSFETHGTGFFHKRITNAEMTGFGFGLGAGTCIHLSNHSAIALRLSYLGTFIYEAEESYFGTRANSAKFLNRFSPELGLRFYL